jgi:hypothetical protein
MTAAAFVLALAALADDPATSYIFPAGGQRGTTVDCRVGGLNLSGECGFRVLGAGLDAPATIRSMPTLILPGPHYQNPIAQQPFDYPQDLAAQIRISADAVPGVRYWYCTTSEGATQLRSFVVGDLPEVLEDERKTRQGRPQKIALPVTVNGRIYPRGDLDEYEFAAKAGDFLNCEVLSKRLGHRLDARLELFDASGRSLAESENGSGGDPVLIARVPADGRYVLRIHDVAFEGNQDYVYRLSVRLGPSVTHVFPAGGKQGDPTRLRLYGPGLSPEGFVDRELVLEETAARAASLPLGFQIGTLPEVLEIEPNPVGAPQKVSLPAVLNGQILPVGDVDCFVFSAAKGQKLDFELFGQRLGSPIQAVVTIQDPAGKQLLRQEGDGILSFSAAADGDYTVRVQELHRETHGGSEYLYRLVAAPPRPEFRLALEKDNLGIFPGQSSRIKVNVVRSGGFSGEIELEFRDLPAGVKAAPAVIPAGAKSVELVFSAAADAPVGETRRAVVTGGASVGGQRLIRAAEVPLPGGGAPGQPHAESLALTVAHPALFTIETEEVYGFANRGTVFTQRFTITRQAGFEGEIELGIADRQARYLQGATGPTILVKAGEKEALYPAFLPESMDLNRTCRIVLTGRARVRDSSGRSHAVTFTTKKQIVVRVSPGILSLSAERDSIEAVRGRTPAVTLSVARTRELTGPVRIEAVLPEESRGIAVKPVTLPEGQETVAIPVELESGAFLGGDGRIFFRATGRRGGHPVVAETAVRLYLGPLPR